MADKKKNGWEEILAKYPGVKFVRFQYCNLQGKFEEKVIFAKALLKGSGTDTADGSSAFGERVVSQTGSDLLLVPILKTFRCVPGHEDVGMVICDVFHLSEKEDSPPEPFMYCSRNLLRMADKKANEVLRKSLQKILPGVKIFGIKTKIVSEFEFLLLPESYDLSCIYSDSKMHKKNYFKPLRGKREEILKEVCINLSKIGISPRMFHAEVSKDQCEIGVEFDDMLTMADFVMIIRQMIIDVASEHGFLVVFDPKFNPKVNGNGGHVHINFVAAIGRKVGNKIIKEEINLFYDKSEKHGFSKMFKQALAGLMKYRLETLLLSNRTISSLERLLSGKEAEAPSKISWGIADRKSSFSVKAHGTKAIRVEDRLPDHVSNVYLTYIAIVLSTIAGINEKLKLSDFKEARELPKGPEAALALFKGSKLLKDFFGEKLIEILHTIFVEDIKEERILRKKEKRKAL